MAVVHVSSWPDFKSAINVSGNTVLVDADMDAANDLISARISAKCDEIDGQGHTLYNFTSTHSDADFWSTKNNSEGYITLRNMNFYNIVSGGSAARGFLDGNNHGFDIYNCRFQGILNKGIISRSRMTNCSCNFSAISRITGSMSDRVEISECWFDIGDSVAPSGAFFCYASSIRFCYFKGKLDVKNFTSNGNVFRGDCQASICNIEITTSSESALSLNLCDRAAQDICLVNSDKIDLPYTAILTIPGNFTSISDADLKTPAAVAATGFTPFVQ